MSEPRVLAIVGSTASGKSELAHRMARHYGDVEILCVDSMTVYRGMDIGTAKPTRAQRDEVPYHLLDLVASHEPFTVAEFQRTARATLDDIASRGQRALLVGGTGLYSRAVIDNFDIPAEFPEIRERLNVEATHSLAALYERVVRLDPTAAAKMEPTNARRIVRALEVIEGTGQPFSSFGDEMRSYFPAPIPQVGLAPPLDEIDAQIARRLDLWLAEGLLDEIAALRNNPLGWSQTASQAVGYKEFIPYCEGTATLEACRDAAVLATRQLVRRQRRWFRRDPRIVWFEDMESAAEHVASWWGPAPIGVGN